MEFEQMATDLGFNTVAEEKKAVAETIRAYVADGGFLFSMCSATDTIDIALAAHGVDIVPQEFDGDPVDDGYEDKLDFSRTFAFENFTLNTDPMVYEFSDIDIDVSQMRQTLNSNDPIDYFELFEFSAKYDPVPTMLTQDHANPIKGFMGQTTAYRKSVIKKHVVIMAESKKTGCG